MKRNRIILWGAVFAVSFAIVFGVLLYRSSKRMPPRQAPAEQLLRYDTQGRNSREIASWIYENYNCHTCHTLTQTGVFGLTSQGQELAKNFEGCPGMMQTVTQSVAISQAQWTDKHRRVRADFERFGCTLCHQVGVESISLTDVGARAASLHMSCPELMSVLNR